MFQRACAANRDAIYALLASSSVEPKRMTATNASAFMIAPGYLVTAAHCVHQGSAPRKPLHAKFELIRLPDIGQQMEMATLHAVDDAVDLALLRMSAPRSTACLELLDHVVPRGTSVGSLGFPLAQVLFAPQGMGFNVVERFQSASISAFASAERPVGPPVPFYETDALMYPGSSGCPGFTVSGQVWGVHH